MLKKPYCFIIPILLVITGVPFQFSWAQQFAWVGPLIRMDASQFDFDHQPRLVMDDEGDIWVSWIKTKADGDYVVTSKVSPNLLQFYTVTGPYNQISNLSFGHYHNNLIVNWQVNLDEEHTRIVSRFFSINDSTWSDPKTMGERTQSACFPQVICPENQTARIFYYVQTPQTWVIETRLFVDNDGDLDYDMISEEWAEISPISDEPTVTPSVIYSEQLWVTWCEHETIPSPSQCIRLSRFSDGTWTEPVSLHCQEETILGYKIIRDYNSRYWMIYSHYNESISDSSRQDIVTLSCEANCTTEMNWANFTIHNSSSRLNYNPDIIADKWGYVWMAWTNRQSNITNLVDDDIDFNGWRNENWLYDLPTTDFSGIGDDLDPFLLYDGKEYIWFTWMTGNDIYVSKGNMAPDPPTSGFFPADSMEIAQLNPTLSCQLPAVPSELTELQRLRFYIFANDGSSETHFTSSGQNYLTLQDPLQDNQTYNYRVSTLDSGDLSSPWSPTITFFTNTLQEPPFLDTDLTIQEVALNGHITTLQPTFRWALPCDHDPLDDMTNIRFQLQISPSQYFEENSMHSFTVAPQTTEFQTPFSLTDNSYYYARLRAIDQTGLYSEWVQKPRFFVNIQNDAPHLQILKPQLDEVVTGLYPCTWEISDPENDSLSLMIEISTNNGTTWGVLPPVDDRDQPLTSSSRQYAVDFNRYNDSVNAFIRITATDYPGLIGSTSATTLSPRFRIFDKGLRCLPQAFSPRSGIDNSTVISFSLDESGTVSLAIYDLKGRRVKVLRDNAYLSPGNYVHEWDGKNDEGKSVSPRPYLCYMFVKTDQKQYNKNLKILILP